MEQAHIMSRVRKMHRQRTDRIILGNAQSEKYFLNEYQTFEELSKAIDEYIFFDNHERYQER